MVRSPEIKNLTRDQLRQEGHDKFWAPVERLIGCVEWGINEKLFLLHTTAWDGAIEGRLETILNNIDHLNKKLVKNFFARPNPLQPHVAECTTYTQQREVPPKLKSGKHHLALLSRYRDNLYICPANTPDHGLELVKSILASILKNVLWHPP